MQKSFSYHKCLLLGAHQRLRHCIRGRCGLLQGLQCNSFSCQRRERTSLHSAPSPNNSSKHTGHQESARDPQRQGEHIRIHAGLPSHIANSHQTNSLKDILPLCRVIWTKRPQRGVSRSRESKCAWWYSKNLITFLQIHGSNRMSVHKKVLTVRMLHES